MDLQFQRFHGNQDISILFPLLVARHNIKHDIWSVGARPLTITGVLIPVLYCGIAAANRSVRRP